MDRDTELNAIGRDLETCEIGMAVLTGKARRRYAAHRKACFTRIAELNREDGLDHLSDDEILEALEGIAK